MERAKEIEIIKLTGSTESEAKKHLDNGSIIYSLDDAINNFDDYFIDKTITEEAQEEMKEDLKEFKDFLLSGKYNKILNDYQIVNYEGVDYLIEFCL